MPPPPLRGSWPCPTFEDEPAAHHLSELQAVEGQHVVEHDGPEVGRVEDPADPAPHGLTHHTLGGDHNTTGKEEPEVQGLTCYTTTQMSVKRPAGDRIPSPNEFGFTVVLFFIQYEFSTSIYICGYYVYIS